jgi:hypothetical protein
MADSRPDATAEAPGNSDLQVAAWPYERAVDEAVRALPKDISNLIDSASQPTTMADVLAVVRTVMAVHPRNWSHDSRDALLWGLLCGWSKEGLAEVAVKHGWSPDKVSQIYALQATLEAAIYG